MLFQAGVATRAGEVLVLAGGMELTDIAVASGTHLLIDLFSSVYGGGESKSNGRSDKGLHHLFRM
jgi:hypothetical protein